MSEPLGSPFNEIRNKIQRALASSPEMPGGGQIVAVSTRKDGLEVTAQHADGVHTWSMVISEDWKW